MHASARGRRQLGAGSLDKRRHAPQISISDDNHHVTEAIGDMYGDTTSEYDQGRKNPRPLSFMPQQPDEISTASPSHLHTTSPKLESPNGSPIAHGPTSDRVNEAGFGQGIPLKSSRNGSADGELAPRSPTLSRSPVDEANSRFPLADVDYESNPAAMAQEMSNLQALRRMSLVDNAAADPDLPSYQSPLMPSVAPTGEDKEEDTSRLFWVPARIHPELAPTEFKTFLENRVDMLQSRRSNDEQLSPDSLQRQNSDGSLRRKRSMLSRQIDNSGGSGADGYKDGAERLERKKSLSGQQQLDLKVSDFQELDSFKDPSKLMRKLSIDTTLETLEGTGPTSSEEDTPILPAIPPGSSLRRSTRTTYRRGSLRKGERVPLSKRAARTAEVDSADSNSSPRTVSGDSTEHGFSRTQTEPIGYYEDNAEAQSPAQRNRLGRTWSLAEDSQANSPEDSTSYHTGQHPSRASAPPSAFPQRPVERKSASNGWTSPASDYDHPSSNIPRIVETPPPSESSDSTYSPHQQQSPQAFIPERKSSHAPPPSSVNSQPPHPPTKAKSPPRKGLIRQAQNARNSGQTLDDIVGQPSPLPGNSTRTDSLSLIPTFNDEKKADKKRDRKERESGESGSSRKSSWNWLRGGEERDKDKDKDSFRWSKSKTSKANDKAHDGPRVDLLASSTENTRGRESLVLDRDALRLEEERKKESSRKSSGGDPKREKETGIFSSLFGGGKKKGDRDSSVGKKDRTSRTLSPDPPHRVLKPDVDYNWTRFSMLEERAIYRLAHIKLTNPRRALFSQVLLSNFMYAYLAKVQQMQPQVSSSSKQQQGQHQQPGSSQNSSDQDQQDNNYYQFSNQHGEEAQTYLDAAQLYEYDNNDQGDLNRAQSRTSSHSTGNKDHQYSNHYYQNYPQEQQQQQQQTQPDMYNPSSDFDDHGGGNRDDEMW